MLRCRQINAELQGVGACGMSHLVNECVQHEPVDRVAHRAPETQWHVDIGHMTGDAEIRNGQRLVGGPFDVDRVGSRRNGAHLAHGRIVKHRRARNLAIQQNRIAVIHDATETCEGRRAVEVVAHVFLTGPCHADRGAGQGSRDL